MGKPVINARSLRFLGFHRILESNPAYLLVTF